MEKGEGRGWSALLYLGGVDSIDALQLKSGVGMGGNDGHGESQLHYVVISTIGFDFEL